MGRFIIPLMIFLVEHLLVVHILLSMAHGSEAAPNVQQQQQLNNIVNRRIGFELAEQGTIADAPASSSSTPEPSETAAEGPYIRRMGKEHLRHHHHSSSDAGGGLIIGGLATAIFAVVFCYIRVTRKTSSTDHHKADSSSMAVGGSTRTDGTTSSASSSSTK